MTDLEVDLVARPALRSRNAVGYITIRSWRNEDRKAQLRAFKEVKAQQDADLVGVAAGEIAAFLRKYIPVRGAIVTSVPCGHSRRPDCFGKRLAQAVGSEVGMPFVRVWADRFCKGVSHPKEFSKLPPLEWIAVPDRLVIVVDDVATSGWHLEEAVSSLSAKGVSAMAVAWIGGSVEGRHSGQQAQDGPADGGVADRQPSLRKRGGVWRM